MSTVKFQVTARTVWNAVKANRLTRLKQCDLKMTVKLERGLNIKMFGWGLQAVGKKWTLQYFLRKFMWKESFQNHLGDFFFFRPVTLGFDIILSQCCILTSTRCWVLTPSWRWVSRYPASTLGFDVNPDVEFWNRLEIGFWRHLDGGF